MVLADFLRKIDSFLIKYTFVPIGFVFKSILGLFFKKHSSPKKILLVKLWALGDSVIFHSFAKKVKECFTDAEIDILTKKSLIDVFKGSKFIHKVIPANFLNLIKLFRKYDLCFDGEFYLNASALISAWAAKKTVGFSHGIRKILYDERVEFKMQHIVQNYLDFLRKLGFNVDLEELFHIHFSEKDLEVAKELINYKESEKILGISPGVGKTAKQRQWPKERFAELIRIVHKKFDKVVIVDQDIKLCEEIYKLANVPNVAVVRKKLNIKELAALLSLCDTFVSCDTGPMHLAAAQGCRVIGLFGPNTPALWRPYNKESTFVYKKMPCSPCIINKYGKIKKCKENICMNDINIEDVLEAISLK